VLLGSGHCDGDFRRLAENDFRDNRDVRCGVVMDAVRWGWRWVLGWGWGRGGVGVGGRLFFHVDGRSSSLQGDGGLLVGVRGVLRFQSKEACQVERGIACKADGEGGCSIIINTFQTTSNQTEPK